MPFSQLSRYQLVQPASAVGISFRHSDMTLALATSNDVLRSIIMVSSQLVPTARLSRSYPNFSPCHRFFV